MQSMYSGPSVIQTQCVSGNGKSVQITKARTFTNSTLLKYSNRTYTCAQNTLIEQSDPILDKLVSDNQESSVQYHSNTTLSHESVSD